MGSHFETEYRGDSDRAILDSLARIEETIYSVAEQARIPPKIIYDITDFDPISYLLENEDDLWLNDFEQHAIQEIKNFIVPEPHRQYGGKELSEFLRNENAIGEFPTKYPTRKISWKGVAGAGMVATAAIGGGIVLKYKTDKQFADVIDEGIAKAKAEILNLFKGNEPPLADLQIDTPADKWIAGEKIVFNASGSSDDKGIERYGWNVDGEKTITSEPKFVQSFSEGNHTVNLTVYDESGKSDNKSVGLEIKEPLPEYHRQLLENPNFMKLSPDAQKFLLDLYWVKDGLDESEDQKLDSYFQLSENPNFSNLSAAAQKFLLGIDWVKDGVDQSEINYISTISKAFNPDDKIKDSDNGKVIDYFEIMYKGNINDETDDLKVVDLIIAAIPSTTKQSLCTSNVYDIRNPIKGKTVRFKTPIDINPNGIKEMLDAIANYEKKTQGLISFNIVDFDPPNGITVIKGGAVKADGSPSCGNVVSPSRNPTSGHRFPAITDGTLSGGPTYIFLGSTACDPATGVAEHELSHALGLGEHFPGFERRGFSDELLAAVTALYSVPPGTDMSSVCSKS